MRKCFMYTILFLLFILGCSDTKQNEVIYKKPASEKLDATCTWLKRDENTMNKNYSTFFYNYYNKNIKEKKYELAAKALELTAWNKASYGLFDNEFYQIIKHFDVNYRTKIPKIRASFIDTYFGDYHTDKGENKKAIDFYKKTIEFDVVDYETCYKKADGSRTIAWSYHSMGKQDLALKYNFEALKYFKKTDLIHALGGVYMNFFSIYESTRNYVKAENALNNAIFYFSKKRDLSEGNIFICLYNKINLYERSKNFKRMNVLIDSTFIAYQKSKLNDPSVKLAVYAYKIEKLITNDSLYEAKKIIDELEPEVIALNSAVSTRQYYVSKAFYEIKNNNGILNTKLIIDAIPTLLENESYAKARDLYSILLNDAESKKDFEKALYFEEERSKATDSLGNQEMANKVAELNTKYQTQEKEQQIKLQKTTILNKNTTIALLASLFIGMFLTVVVYITRQKQKKLKLEKENVQQYTKQLLEKTEEERKRIASDLHDSVSHELLSLKNSFDTKTDTTNTKIDAIINDIRIISRNLHPIMFDKIGLKESVMQLVERAQSVNNFMVTAEIDYTNSLSTNDELQVYRIMQEALSNIIKYAKAVAAKIIIQEKNKSIFIEIKDNGKGFNVAETLNGKNAFGLHNIIERARAIGGEAKINSNKNGTVINIEIKKQ